MRAHGGTWDTWEYLGLHGAHRKYLGAHGVFGGTWGSWGYMGVLGDMMKIKMKCKLRSLTCFPCCLDISLMLLVVFFCTLSSPISYNIPIYTSPLPMSVGTLGKNYLPSLTKTSCIQINCSCMVHRFKGRCQNLHRGGTSISRPKATKS